MNIKIESTYSEHEQLINNVCAVSVHSDNGSRIKLHNLLMLKLSDVPFNNLQPAPRNISGPIIDYMRFVEDEMQEKLFANLIALSMIKDKAELIHHSFVDLIKQLTGDEIKILQAFQVNDRIPALSISINFDYDGSKSKKLITHFYQDLVLVDSIKSELFLNNLMRLDLISISETNLNVGLNYEDLEKEIDNLTIQAEYAGLKGDIFVSKEVLTLSKFGEYFVNLLV